jgi:hypothetical protein
MSRKRIILSTSAASHSHLDTFQRLEHVSNNSMPFGVFIVANLTFLLFDVLNLLGT